VRQAEGKEKPSDRMKTEKTHPACRHRQTDSRGKALRHERAVNGSGSGVHMRCFAVCDYSENSIGLDGTVAVFFSQSQGEKTAAVRFHFAR
jgi:hypothetical protein